MDKIDILHFMVWQKAIQSWRKYTLSIIITTNNNNKLIRVSRWAYFRSTTRPEVATVYIETDNLIIYREINQSISIE